MTLHLPIPFPFFLRRGRALTPHGARPKMPDKGESSAWETVVAGIFIFIERHKTRAVATGLTFSASSTRRSGPQRRRAAACPRHRRPHVYCFLARTVEVWSLCVEIAISSVPPPRITVVKGEFSPGLGKFTNVTVPVQSEFTV